MHTVHPTYIVADIPEPIHSEVMALRKSCCGRTDSVPAEITLAGSSGVGPIPLGTDVEQIVEKIREVLEEVPCFEMSFSGWKVFPNTTIAYLEPLCREQFDALHEKFASSGIPFSESPFPYNPHCTIGSSWEPEEFSAMEDIPFPTDTFTIATVRLVDLNHQTLECNELARFTLKGEIEDS